MKIYIVRTVQLPPDWEDQPAPENSFLVVHLKARNVEWEFEWRSGTPELDSGGHLRNENICGRLNMGMSSLNKATPEQRKEGIFKIWFTSSTEYSRFIQFICNTVEWVSPALG